MLAKLEQTNSIETFNNKKTGNLLANLKQLELSETFDTKSAEQQIKMLHSKADKYITVATIEANKKYHQWHYTIDELEENLEKLISLNLNTYISPNEFYLPKRASENIRRLNALYIDLDLKDKSYDIKDYELDIAIDILTDNYFNKIIPEPTMLIKSGKGLHLYWKIEDLPSQGLPLWTLVQDKIVEKMRAFNEDFRLFKIDESVKDCTRILRLSDTINLKNNTNCKLEFVYDENIYRLDTLIKEYFPELSIIEKQKKERVKLKDKEEKKIVAIFNLHKLHYTRLKDIVKLQQMRNTFTLDGRRRMIFMYRYYSCLFNRDTELALENTLDFNSKFIEPLSYNEAIQASNSAEKAYEEWLTNTEEDFKKPVWNRETNSYNIKGYNYSNTKLISLLEITIEEQRELSTIISKRVKQDRQNDSKKKKRRNDNGLTITQQNQLDLYIRILKEREVNPKISIRKLEDKLKSTKSKIETALKNWSNKDISEYINNSYQEEFVLTNQR